MEQQLSSTITLGNGENTTVTNDITAPAGQPAVDITGNRGSVTVAGGGSVSAPDDGNSAIVSSGNGVSITNRGDISGAFNGITSSGNGFNLNNSRAGTISSDSRAVDITDGDNINVANAGTILGTGDQRNGTLYVDGTVDNFSLINQRSGTIDAGAGNTGDGFSVQVGAEGDPSSTNINAINAGTIAGRGEAAFAPGEGRLTANGSSGVRFFNGSGAEEAEVVSFFTNRGSITSETTSGFLGGFVVEDGVAYQGQITNSGLISGPQNGLYFGDADHQAVIVNQGQGRIESGSRAVNLDGDDIVLRNSADIVGTGDQRNGTIYVDGTGDDIRIVNQSPGVIDAGVGNSGSGVSVQVGAAGGLSDGSDDLETSTDIVNSGLIQGRGSGNVPVGVRLFVGSGLETSTFSGEIINRSNGTITSEQSAGILIEEGVIFDGRIRNAGTISGGNGLAVDASGAFGDIDFVNRSSGDLEGAVILGEGDDTFVNRNNADLDITGGGGDDVLTGGSGATTFRFDSGSGDDTIRDFQINQDVIDVGSYFGGAGGALDAATQVGNNTLITFDDDNSLTLSGVQASSLTENNFTVA